MLLNQLTLAYECLSAIGNTLELDSMIFEVLTSFSRKTGAITARYYKNKIQEEPFLHIGKKLEFTTDINIDKEKRFLIVKENDLEIIILPLKYGCMVFVYKNHPNINKLAAMLGNFQSKINLSISACKGVQELEEMVESSVNQIQEKEKMLLAQSKQAIMGEMLEMIAHQWRQPLTAIGMTSANIAMDLALDELNVKTLQDDLNNINTQVQYLSSTIDDFRNFLKESKEKEKISSRIITESVKGLVFLQLHSQQIDLQVQECEDIIINIYKNELIQVILNIISNAKDSFENLNSLQQNKIIQLKCSRAEDDLKICIIDNGGGIPDEIMPRIFEPYYSTKKEKNGTGLGLYMSKIIVQEHLKGKLFAKNTVDGVAFTIQIPIWESNDES
ncbi:MAG: two-component system C4-dicarboxylate transport sensor histidine kinase DctB [Sulfurimonas sp.]|jgi:two-component system C4-dicarboxylate transport sensor histidine kinase DctB|uniref:sensor histidine kinase n=1 Tax=Sulfurimonas sp. TaxID=2022749 RepID=UPI0039E4A376